MAVFQTTWRLDPNILNLEYIKRFIPLVLDLEKAEYSYWSYLFRVTARAHNLLHHIDSTIPAPSDIDASDMAQLDAIVLHWIHSTISTDLLVAILNEKSTAMDTWTRLRDLFQHSNKSNTHQNSLPQTLNLLSSYVEQQPVPPGKKRKLIIDLNEVDETENMDLISGLPDDVLVYLLSLVDMKTAGKTSVLSKRWRYVWTHLMELDFDSPETYAIANGLKYTYYALPEMNTYVKWVNQVIRANRAPYLNTFRIHFILNKLYAPVIENWLKFAFSKEVRNLEINLSITYPRIQFSNIFSTNPSLVMNTTLESLHLKFVCIDGPLLEWVISNCLNLKSLLLHSCKASSVASSKHRKLIISSAKLKHLEFFYSLEPLNFEALHIFAPNLASFVFFESIIDVEYRSVTSLVDAAFGQPYCRHIFHNSDILSGFSSQLEKLSVECRQVSDASTGFPTLVNVKQLEIKYWQYDDDPLSLISLIEACPLLHTFKLKLPLYTSSIYGHRPNSSVPKAAQVRAICSHQHLQTVEYVGYTGCTSSSKLALFLTQHAPMLNKFIFDPHQPQVVGKPETRAYGSEFCDKVAIARRHAEQLAKQIRGGVDVVIL